MLLLSTESCRSTTRPLLLLFLYTAGLILLSLSRDAAASAVSFSFDFTNPSTYRLDNLKFEGDAAVNGCLVDLTSTSSLQSVGRMSYNHPVPFYDNTTGQVASFTTWFTFAIKSDATYDGDGMAFFLSSYPSRLPLNSSGGYLGLQGRHPGADRFIAVEFDTFGNIWDPCDTHIAIDINNVMYSTNDTCLPSSSLEGTMTASITFNASTNMLVASLHWNDQRPSLVPSPGAPSRAVPSTANQVSVQLADPVTSLLPPQVAVGFSASTGAFFEHHEMLSWSFDSTLATRTETSAPEAQQKPAVAVSAKPPKETVAPESQSMPAPLVTQKGHAAVIIREAVLFIAILVASALVWFTLSWYRWKRTRDSFANGTIGLKRFDYSVLAMATSKFSEEKRLGEGAFGAVYGGSLTDEDGTEQKVAVKKIKDTRGKTKDFIAELKTISETRHMNLVRLIGWCCSPTMMDVMCWSRQQNVKLFLVYELVSNSNLDYHLHRRDQVLPWPTRYQIVKGIASALHYLHHEKKPHILHRDIKPSNILLDDGFNAKLADFGLSRIANHNSTTPPTMAIGTEGYIDPQCRKHGLVKFGRRSDVYGFGIVLLDIACTDMPREQVWELYRHGTEPQVEAAADAKLRGVFDRKQMERVVDLGLRCSDPDGDKRPTMHDAMQFLEHGTEFPAMITKEDGQGSVSITMNAEEEVLPPPGAGSSSELTLAAP